MKKSDTRGRSEPKGMQGREGIKWVGEHCTPVRACVCGRGGGPRHTEALIHTPALLLKACERTVDSLTLSVSGSHATLGVLGEIPP